MLNELKERKSSAFKTLYLDYFGMVNYFVSKNNGNQDDAGDVFQDGMVIFYEKLNTPGFSLTCSIKTFIYAICRNVWLKKLQRQNRLPYAVRDFEKVYEMVIDDEVENNYTQQAFRAEKALEKLGEHCKKLLEQFYYLKTNMKDLAIQFGYTNEDNAKNQKYKCLQRLKLLVQASE